MKKILCVIFITGLVYGGGGHGARHGHMGKSIEESEEESNNTGDSLDEQGSSGYYTGSLK